MAACTSGGESDKPPAAGSTPRVVFFGEGAGTKGAAITMGTETGGTIQKDMALPIVNTATGTQGLESTLFKRGAPLYFSMRNKADAGSVTCRIEVDGKVVDEATSAGAYVTATCVGKVP